jgi:hypothetical protein
MAYARGGAVEITFNDQRMERWTAVGQRYVVEHYYPAPRIPAPVPAPTPELFSYETHMSGDSPGRAMGRIRSTPYLMRSAMGVTNFSGAG